MLNFRNTSIAFAGSFILLSVIDSKYDVPWFSYIALFILYTLVLFWGSYYVGSNFYFKVICSGTTTKQQIAISFDDGPLLLYTPVVLDILKEEKVPATFFCIGKRAAEHPNLLAKIHEAGHLIGNHSYSHSGMFDLLPAKKMTADLQQMNEVVRQTLGIRLNWFRPPYGVTNPNLGKAVKRNGLTSIGWNIRSLDTVTSSHEKLKERVLKQLKPGAVILFHDTCESTVKMLPAFLKDVKARGYEIVPLDKLLDLQPYA